MRPGLLPPLDSPYQLVQKPLLIPGASRDDAVPLRWVSRDGARPPVQVDVEAHVYSDDLGSLVGLCLGGYGVVLAPDYSVRHLLDSGQLIDLLPDWLLPIPEGDTIRALTLPLPMAPESAQAFVRFVIQRLR